MIKESEKAFDLCVIGCGPGGLAGAMRALDLGKHVCIIEKAQVGGAGVMWGALASKTMWELSKDFAVANAPGRGYTTRELTANYTLVRHAVLAAIREKQAHIRRQLQVFSPDHYSGPGSITFKRGTAGIASSTRVVISRRSGRTETIDTANILICSGSKPRQMPHVPVDQQRILDSDGILRLKTFPKRMMIVGAGIVGCEYATIFSNYDQTDVLVVDHKERILPFEDEDISDFVSQNLIQNGVTILHSSRLEKVEPTANGVSVFLADKEGNVHRETVDVLLVSIGRVPNTIDLGLDNVGISPDEKGFLKVTDACRVDKNIYAAGDITLHPALVNLAESEARHAVKRMFGDLCRPQNYDNISTVMFFKPPVAAVGLNEKECRTKKIAYKVGVYANALLPRAIAMRATDGFVKIIISRDKPHKILGMRAAGPQASNTIMTIAMLMDQNTDLEDALKTSHPHPTISEGIQECLRMLLGKSIYKPSVFPHLAHIRNWGPD